MSLWYTVFCKPRGEWGAERNLCNQGFHVYLPRLIARRKRAGAWTDWIEPLFPRYLFIQPRDARHSLAPVRSTPGVSDLVRMGGQPASLPQAVIDQLRACEDLASGARSAEAGFHSGEKIKFVDGPFAGLEAVFEMDLGSRRALVLLDLLGKTNRLQVERDWLALLA